MTHPEELIGLVEFEEQLDNHLVGDNVTINLLGDYTNLRKLSLVKVIINSGHNHFQAKLDDLFIAQIIKRTYDNESFTKNETTKSISVNVNLNNSTQDISWKEENDFLTELYRLKIYLHYNLNDNFDLMISKITKTLKGLVILWYQGNGKNIVYGFVSQKYTRTNQLKFREQFISLCQRHSDIINISDSKTRKKQDRVIELFSFNKNKNDDIELICGLTYGKNNGFGSYYVFWLRRITESNSFLMPFTSEHKFNWKNNPLIVKNTGETLESFVEYIISEGVKIQKINKALAERAKAKILDENSVSSIFNKVLDKAKVANASKDRCMEYFNEKYKNNKHTLRNSLWAMGESIAYTGTHNKAVPESMKQVLRDLCTRLLELGLEEFENKYQKDDFNVTIKVR